MTHYIYKYPDGHVEEDDIPWPFRYPNAFDPFVRAAPQIPDAAAPAGIRARPSAQADLARTLPAAGGQGRREREGRP